MRRRSLLASLFIGALVFSTGAIITRAQSEIVSGGTSISAEVLDVDLDTGEIVYRGNASSTFGDLRLFADEIRWHRADNRVTARGHIIAEQHDIRILAEEMTYHTVTQNYTVTDLRFGRAPLYISGEMLSGSADELSFTNAVVSFGEPSPWAPTITADALLYFPIRERMQTRGGRVGLGFFQPIPLPSTPLPTNLPWVQDLTFDGGYTGRLGAHLLIGAQAPLRESLRLGAELGLYFKRGVMFGPTFSYGWNQSSDTATVGSFRSGYIYDSGRRLSDILGNPISNDRGIITWQHRQAFSPNLTLNADLNYWSDSEVIRDFRARDFSPVQVPDSFAELSHTGTNTTAGLFMRAQPNDYHRIRQRLPELTFDLLPTPLGSGWLQELHASAAGLRESSPTSGTDLRSDRLDLYYGLTRPWRPESWLTVNPVVGARATHYTRALGNQSDYTRLLGELGVDAELHASAVFAYQNERWGINGLRHLVTPRLSYRYIPDADKGATSIPPIDRRVFSTYLEPLALGARRQIDQLSRSHTLRLALDQRLQTRADIYGSRDLAHLVIAADSRFDRLPGQRTLSSLHSELHLTPVPFLDFRLYHRVTPGDWTLRELNSAITLRSAETWSVTLAIHYLEGDIQEFITGFAYRLNEVYEGYGRFHFDSSRDRFVEQTFGVRQSIANRWVVGYELSFYEGPRRESDFGFSLVLDTIRF
ncbi:MAG: LPS assembly protein LptD [Candidatus Synoicihabitans palmerolidicus]|nr:LPS assembly protein LptD [Candidatus Synoicihabitans palmerolidicus]